MPAAANDVDEAFASHDVDADLSPKGDGSKSKSLPDSKEGLADRLAAEGGPSLAASTPSSLSRSDEVSDACVAYSETNASTEVLSAHAFKRA